jgi:hypothetical protein
MMTDFGMPASVFLLKRFNINLTLEVWKLPKYSLL